MLRIAIPVWHGRVSPVFDEAKSLQVVIVDRGRIVRRELYPLDSGMMARIRYLQALKVDVLVCGAVTRELSFLLKAAGVRVVSQISGPAAGAVEAYIDSIGSKGT